MSDRTCGRRSFVGDVLTGATGLVLLGAPRDATAAVAAPAGTLGTLPWPRQPLDPEVAAERAFQAYSNGHCTQGAFEGIVGPAATSGSSG